ncbi:MAG: hypothetical protein IKD54_08410 [Clostridia bacterium]|nr:hypothetical protein [Clostridia bacterium]
MKDFRIIFNGTDPVALPDGICLGVIGEHNAVQLVITLPDSMIVNMDYHTVTIGGIESARIVSTSENVDGAFRVDNVIYQPLTATYTTQRIVDVSVTAYRQVGDSVLAVDKTQTVYGLRFDAGQKIQMIGGLAAEVAALEVRTDALEDDVAELAGKVIKTVAVLPDDPDDDEIVYLNASDSGFYRWDGSDWVRLTDDGEGLIELANIVSAMGDKVNKIAVVEKYSDLSDSEYEDALAAFVYGLDGGQKSLADFDPETDADAELLIDESVDYEESATISGDMNVLEASNITLGVGLNPVYETGTAEPTGGVLGMMLETNASNPKTYMPVLFNTEQSEEYTQQIVDAFELDVPSGAEVYCLFALAFEDVTGRIVSDGASIGENLSFTQGWNAIVLVESEEMTVGVYQVQDVNAFFNLGTFVSLEEAQGLSYLLSTIVFNSTTDKRGLYVKTDGEWIDPYRTDDSDDVTMLGFETYSDLVVRDEAVTGESIMDVPVFVQGEQGTVCSLYEYTSDPVGLDYDDGIELSDLRQYDTGMPLFVVSVTVGGVRYAYFPQDYNGGLAGMVYAGWNVNNQPSDPPTITSFTPDRFSFGGVVYDDLDDLPDAAKSALRSLSQCVNVSAAAMGTIRAPEDAVTRFSGTFETNRKYHFTTGSDCTFTLPSVPFTESDAQFVLYLTCTQDVDLTFPQGTRFAGGTAPNSDAGSHKIIGCWLKDAGAWAIGGIDYSEVS